MARKGGRGNVFMRQFGRFERLVRKRLGGKPKQSPKAKQVKVETKKTTKGVELRVHSFSRREWKRRRRLRKIAKESRRINRGSKKKSPQRRKKNRKPRSVGRLGQRSWRR